MLPKCMSLWTEAWHTDTGILISSVSRGSHAYGKDCSITAILKILKPYRKKKKIQGFICKVAVVAIKLQDVGKKPIRNSNFLTMYSFTIKDVCL